MFWNHAIQLLLWRYMHNAHKFWSSGCSYHTLQNFLFLPPDKGQARWDGATGEAEEPARLRRVEPRLERQVSTCTTNRDVSRDDTQWRNTVSAESKQSSLCLWAYISDHQNGTPCLKRIESFFGSMTKMVNSGEQTYERVLWVYTFTATTSQSMRLLSTAAQTQNAVCVHSERYFLR